MGRLRTGSFEGQTCNNGRPDVLREVMPDNPNQRLRKPARVRRDRSSRRVLHGGTMTELSK